MIIYISLYIFPVHPYEPYSNEEAETEATE